MLTCEHQQPRRRHVYPYVPNAAPSRNPTRLVVAVAVVLGLETAEVIVTENFLNFITRGTKASWPVKQGRS